MDSSMCTGHSPVTNRDLGNLPDDLMFGFDVKDDDREYLAEIVMCGMGHEPDIKGFVRLSLQRGMEEWEQALSCATAMRDRGFCYDSLDGQDILTFLAKIYGVNGPSHTASALSPRQGPEYPHSKRKSRKVDVQDAAIPSEIPTKRRKQTKKSNNSPYWDNSHVLSLTENQLEAETMTKEVPMKGEESLGGMITPTSILPMQELRESTITQILKGPELTPVSLHDRRKSWTPASSIDTQEHIGYLGDDSPGETSRETSPALSASDASTLPDPSASEPDTEFDQAIERVDSSSSNQASDNEDKLPPSQIQTPKRKAKSPYFVTTKAAAAPSPAKSPKKKPLAGTPQSRSGCS
ncbi:hypothetical protein O1611_g7982 [Lasiodiplodia mahajangana]|uniref:Uncharacterized protein n=1 Tax=Lasiodiplodia mahajangana TaxID=1108764 RepID=A0ACC2JE58_9PEZI|nr:hypothetical protein O1611_g7982 [Lasiodiplodia mahajangana]